MAILLNTDGTSQHLVFSFLEEDDVADLLGGPVLAVSAKDGNLLILREYKDEPLPPENLQAEKLFDVWPVCGPAIHCKAHEWEGSMESGSRDHTTL
jgi:hypothetical protein